MSFEDRLSRRVVDAPPAGTHHAGRWIVKEDATTQLNRVVASSGHALMPGPTGEWEVGKVGLGNASVGQFFPEALPSDQDAEALRQLGERLRGEAHDGWLAWSEINPLAPRLDEVVRPRPFEGRIAGDLQHLEAVCRKPRTHIRLEVERELVGRARRMARDAPEWLAAHTEDWHHRTLAGVQPRRIRAEIREERWDLYENRLAARLVDSLIVWLRRRIAEVRLVRESILAHIASFDATSQGSRHRFDRICRLWGEALNAANSQQVADKTLRRLERLLYKVLALQDSSLYRYVPRRAQVSRTLRMTNLLTTDDHYRGVARLWHQWSLLPRRGSLSPRMHYQRQQDLHQSFDAWCMLLVVRACSQLRLCPAADDDWESSLARGRSIQLENALRIEWEENGGISIVSTRVRWGGVLCRFVPLLQSLERARTKEGLAQRIGPIVDAVAEEPHWTVVLHPASESPAPYDAIATVGNPPQPRVQGAVDFIRVSPYSLDCIERVARAIRWATLVPRMLAYPPRISTLPDKSLAKELRLEIRNGQWAMTTLPKDRRRAQAGIEDRLDDARTRHGSLQHQRANAKREGRHDKRLLVSLRKAEKAVDEWCAVKRSVDDAIAELCELQTCPRCGQEAELQQRAELCFAARCESDSCRAQWELRPLPDGRGRVPVLDAQVPTAGPYEIDGLVGCDILALPSEDGRGFLAPRPFPVPIPVAELLRTATE